MSPQAGSVRIVGGRARGRRIAVPSVGTRPTSARAREALFNRLDTLLDVAGSRMLDLYAGSGAVGLEALSRGAEHVRFVESERRTAELIVRNAAALDVARTAFVVDPRAVERLAADPAIGEFDIVFADPPYALDDTAVRAVLTALTAPGRLSAGGIAVLERSTRTEEPSWPEWVEPLGSRRYGEGSLWYGRACG